MNSSRAIEIISALADGFDPHTGEVFAEDSPYQHPETVRALFFGLDQLKKSKHRVSSLPNNAGTPWSIEEEEELVKEFKSGRIISSISTKHGRTRGAIQARLKRLNLILPDSPQDPNPEKNE